MKITSKRQVTFPKHVLDAMGVGPRRSARAARGSRRIHPKATANRLFEAGNPRRQNKARHSTFRHPQVSGSKGARAWTFAPELTATGKFEHGNPGGRGPKLRSRHLNPRQIDRPEPRADFERCLSQLDVLVNERGCEMFASQSGIGEAYAALIHHYDLSSADARVGLRENADQRSRSSPERPSGSRSPLRRQRARPFRPPDCQRLHAGRVGHAHPRPPDGLPPRRASHRRVNA